MDEQLVNLLAAVMPGGIEQQEKQGQRDLTRVASKLPIEGTTDRPETRARWESVGFKFGAAADNLFVYCTFPPGWSIKPTDHAMWSDILDDKGRRRGGVFYKAAFYDRKANADGPFVRYEGAGEGGYGFEPRRCGVLDNATGKMIHVVVTFPSREEYYRGDNSEKAKVAVNKWLAEHYPNHSDPTAYWD